MNFPFFSILTASLNSMPTFWDNLESMMSQNFKDFEHIVIDGGSDDGTLDLLKKFENFYNLHWISEPDGGIADALNKGLHIAKGQYIIVIQADDRLLGPDTLEKVYPLLNSEKAGIYSFPVVLDHRDSGKVLRKPIRWLWWNHFKFILPHQGCFVSRKVFDQVGEFRKEFKINMDYDFFYRALERKVSVKFGKFPVTLMGGSGIGSDPANMMKRLKEERSVQKLNEKNMFWRVAQFIFHSFYMTYKINILSAKKERD
jgi:glycosyltransferase involved in cell wall biosynthesis